MKTKFLNHKSLFIILFVFVIFFGLAGGAEGAEWYVRTDGHDASCNGLYDASVASAPNCAYLTVQKGVNIATAGDTIHVGDGSYPEHVVISSKSGSEGNLITIKSQNRRNAIIKNIYLTGTSSYWRIEELSFNGTAPGIGNDCVYAAGGHNQIIDNAILNCPYNSIRVFGAHDLIEDNYMEYTQFGITLETASSYATVRNNEINHLKKWSDADTDYMRLWGEGHLITQNNFHGPNNHSDVIGSHIDCFQSWDGVGWGYLRNITIERNHCANAHQVGMIELGTNCQSYNVTVKNNIFEFMQAGIGSGSIVNFKYYNNIEAFFSQGDSGISHNFITCPSTGGEVYNNIFYTTAGREGDNTWDIWGAPNNGTGSNNLDYRVGKTYTNPLYNNDVKNQNPNFTNIPKDMRYLARNTNSVYDGNNSTFEVRDSDVSYFTIGEYIEYCPYHNCDGVVRQITSKNGSLIGFSPLISDYIDVSPSCEANDFCYAGIVLWGTNGVDWNKNWNIRSDSPAKDAGYSVVTVINDFINNLRPQGSDWDIGAYEYVQESDTTPPAAPSGLTVN